jgi:hypothetical protein
MKRQTGAQGGSMSEKESYTISPQLLAGAPLNPWLAFLFGLIFGPFGLIYVNRRMPRALTGTILTLILAVVTAGVFLLLAQLIPAVWIAYPLLFAFISMTAAKTYNQYIRTTSVVMNWSLSEVPELAQAVRRYFKESKVNEIFDGISLPAAKRKDVLDTMVEGALKRFLARLSLTLKPADLDAFTALLDQPAEAMTFLKARIPNWEDILQGESHNFLRSFAETLLKDDKGAV